MNVQAIQAAARDRRGVITVALVVAAAAVSVFWSTRFLPFVFDDAMISFRYSERFLEGRGLTWNDGEYVEGYSDLLWVLLVAAGGLIQRNLVLVGWILGLLANVVALIAIAWAFGQRRTETVMPLLGGMLVLVTSQAFALWGVGGLETPLVLALLALAFGWIIRPPEGRLNWVYSSLMLALLCITRPDGIVLAGGVAAGVVLRDGLTIASIRRGAVLFSLPAVFFISQVLFRLGYYGSPVPNTAYVKVAFSAERLWVGLSYLKQGAFGNIVPTGAMAIGALWLWMKGSHRALRDLLLFVVPAILWLAYVVTIGGDNFPFYRHWMPVLVCLAFGVASVVDTKPAMRLVPGVTLLAIALIAQLIVVQLARPWAVPGVQSSQTREIQRRVRVALPNYDADPLDANRRFISDCMTFGAFLHAAFSAERPLIAVNTAGCMPFSSKLPALDMLGLTDAYIARHRPADMGQGPIAHELGDGVYTLSRKPDLVTFCMPATGAAQPCFRGEMQMARLAGFQDHYRQVLFRTGSLDGIVWVRAEDGRLGIRRTHDLVQIPGFLLAGDGTRALLDSSGRLVAVLERGEAEIKALYLPAGVWNISVSAESASPLRLATGSGTDSHVIGSEPVRIESSGTPLSFRILGGSAVIRGITARRYLAGH